MPLKDPPRLLDSPTGTPDFLRDALDAGRADVPRVDQLARLAQRLPIDVPPPGPGSAVPAPVAAIPSAPARRDRRRRARPRGDRPP